MERGLSEELLSFIGSHGALICLVGHANGQPSCVAPLFVGTVLPTLSEPGQAVKQGSPLMKLASYNEAP